MTTRGAQMFWSLKNARVVRTNMFRMVVHLGQVRHYQGFQPSVGKFMQQLQ